jgi:steroid delta-isomerase-like uncharacterized protein
MAVSSASEAMLRDYAAAWRAHDIERVVGLFTDDAVYEDVPLGRVNRGRGELRAFLVETFQTFPDYAIELTAAFVAGARAGAEWTMTGTQRGALPGLPATGKRMAVRGASMLELRGNKIARIADYYDQLGMLRQLAAIPPPGQAPS